jgi:hypothetical protein
MKKSEVDRIVAEMVTEMLRVERFTVQDFKNRWPYAPATFGALITKAYDVMRSTHGVEFRPGPYDTRFRANYKETLNRSHRQRNAGIRKLDRSAVRAEVAATNAPDEQTRERIERIAELQKLQAHVAKVRSRRRLEAL